MAYRYAAEARVMTFAEKVIAFNRNLELTITLPPGIAVMNPFKENREALAASSAFYRKFYNDHRRRRIILGINPGRKGAGITGVPFTDTKRLKNICGIEMPGYTTHEPSSVFVYELIDACGGAAKFYNNFYIGSVCPLGFVTTSGNRNYNYFQTRALRAAVTPFIIETLKQQIGFGIETDICYCLGNTDNFRFLNRLNDEHQFFKKIIPMEHPRYIIQYRSGDKARFIEEFLHKLGI